MATLTDETTDLLFEQLKHVEGKAEIVNGRIVVMPPVVEEVGLSRAQIALSLRDYVNHTARSRNHR